MFYIEVKVGNSVITHNYSSLHQLTHSHPQQGEPTVTYAVTVTLEESSFL